MGMRQLIEGEGVRRSTTFRVPPEMLVVIGVDTEHRSLSEHPAFDPRVLNVHANLKESDPDVRSMVEIGVQQAIKVEVVSVDGVDTYIVRDGRGRTLKSRLANKILERTGLPHKTVPVDAYRGNENNARLGMTMQIVLNEHRDEDTPMNRAHKAQYLLDTGYDVASVADMFRVTTQSVRDWIKLLDLDPEVQSAVDGGVSPTALVKLHGLSSEEQKDALKQLVNGDGKPTVRKANAIAEGKKNGNGGKVNVAPTKNQLRKVIKDNDGRLSEDFILALRIAVGDASPDTVNGLPEMLRGETLSA